MSAFAAPEPRPVARRALRASTVLAVVLLGWAALGLTVLMLPGVSADSGWAVLLAAVVLGLLGAGLRPAMAVLLAHIGWAGVCAGWLIGQALLVFLALSITPGLHVDGFWSAFWASWIYSALASAGLWFVTAGQPGMITRHLLRVNRRYRRAAPTSAEPGLVMIQIDGLSEPLARWAISAGRVARAAARHHPGEPGRAVARAQRRDPGVPLVREGLRAHGGDQPAAGQRAGRGAPQQRSGSARRRRGQRQQRLLR
jgi:uncharacterized membrane protein YvlD (DUF360 family)